VGSDGEIFWLNNNMLLKLQNIYMLMEDYNSSVNQTKNILKNNNVQNWEQITKDLERIYDSVRFEDDEHKNSRSDQDIPSLAFLILTGWNTNRISELYNKYCNTKAIYSKNYLTRWSQEIRNTIQKNKWFKPSEEKTKYLQEEATALIELVHKHYVPVENKTEEPEEYKGDDEDVVFDNDKLLIYRADSMDKCILYGNKNLCISYPKKDNYYWKYRLGKMRGDDKGMTTYFVNWKDGSNKILIDALGDEDGGVDAYSWNPISTNSDSDISKEELIRKFPELKEPFDRNVFQFVEYGENEKRAYEIDENIRSILDKKLNGFSDYDIFVQLDKNISDSDWNNLKLDDKTKRILFKKYMGAGGFVSLENIEKYGTTKDLPWYEDILSRAKDKSIRYYLNVKGDVTNPKIKEYYLEEKVRVDELEKQIRQGKFILLRGQNLYFLPDLEDVVWEGYFDCSNNQLQSLQGAPQKVGGYFNCYNNQLQSLQGAPQTVGGYFSCHDNQLQSLQGAPQTVGGYFSCHDNQLQSLQGAPQTVGGYFSCSYNQLQSLQGAPQKVGGYFHCHNNQLQSLQGAPQKVGGYFSCYNNQLQSLQGAPQKVGGDFHCHNNQLQSLQGAPQKVGGYFNCSDNQLQSLQGAPQKVGGDFNCYNNQLQSLQGAPQKVGGYFHCHNNQLQSLQGAPQYDLEMEQWGINFKKQLQDEIKAEIASEDTLKEHYNFQYLIERVADIFQESVSKPIDKKIIKQISRDMEQVEINNFSMDYAADYEDLEYDSKLKGFMGYGLFENDKMVGYIYGYQMGADGEYEDVDINSINFYDNDFKKLLQTKGFERVCNPRHTFYVSNLAINRENRIGLTKILSPFLNDIRKGGYKFIVFDGLEDTLRLLRNKDRLQNMGMEILADVEDYDSSLVLLCFN
jgi:hypothetical protein